MKIGSKYDEEFYQRVGHQKIISSVAKKIKSIIFISIQFFAYLIMHLFLAFG
jgi:hypothetical protein